jgi:hypothetical protein
MNYIFSIIIAAGISNCKAREYESGYFVLSSFNNLPVEALYYRAIAAHQLQKKEEALSDIDELLYGWFPGTKIPDRYLAIAAAMKEDISTWKKKDLFELSRKMGDVSRRLELQKAGKETRRRQKEIVIALDERIKELENQKNNNSSGGKQEACPPSKEFPKNEQQTSQTGLPLDDSQLGGTMGKGAVDPKRMKEIAQVWGSLPEKERARAMVEITRGIPPRYKDAIESYFRKLETGDAGR